MNFASLILTLRSGFAFTVPVFLFGFGSLSLLNGLRSVPSLRLLASLSILSSFAFRFGFQIIGSLRFRFA